MDLTVAAAFFDDQLVTDAYSGATAFYGQPDLYDLAERDSETGFRRSLSAQSPTVPSRGCVTFGGDTFIVGRTVKDFFQGGVVRTYLLLHPSDGLISYGSFVEFLASTTTSCHAGASWLKNRKFELLDSDLIPEFDFYVHTSETPVTGDLIKDVGGVYYRVQAAAKQTSKMLRLTAFTLGAAIPHSVSYVAATGTFNATTGLYGTAAPVSVTALIEPYRLHYKFTSADAEKYKTSDVVITVRAADIASPVPGDVFVDGSETYNFLEKQTDGYGSWEIHARSL